MNSPATGRLLSWELLDVNVEKGWIKLGFETKPEFLNFGQHVQGGFVCGMLDDALGAVTIAKTEGKFRGPTIDLHTHFLNGLKMGKATVEAKVVKLGSRISFAEAVLYDCDGKACAKASSSAILVPLDLSMAEA